MESDRLFEFLQIASKLKKVKRSGWISEAKVEDPESVADHSFMCTLLAMCFGDLKSLDVQKVMRMALLHDIHEVIIGDYDRSAKEKIGSLQMKAMEKKAISEVLSSLPARLKTQYFSLWEEFENQKTPEAILVKEIDKIEMVIQALEYQRAGYDPKRLDTFWNSVQKKVQDPALLRLLEVLSEARRSLLLVHDKNERIVP